MNSQNLVTTTDNLNNELVIGWDEEINRRIAFIKNATIEELFKDDLQKIYKNIKINSYDYLAKDVTNMFYCVVNIKTPYNSIKSNIIQELSKKNRFKFLRNYDAFDDIKVGLFQGEKIKSVTLFMSYPLPKEEFFIDKNGVKYDVLQCELEGIKYIDREKLGINDWIYDEKKIVWHYIPIKKLENIKGNIFKFFDDPIPIINFPNNPLSIEIEISNEVKDARHNIEIGSYLFDTNLRGSVIMSHENSCYQMFKKFYFKN